MLHVLLSLLAAVQLPPVPAAFSAGCGAVGGSGKMTTGHPAILADGFDRSTPGVFVARFRVTGYRPKAELSSSSPMLVFQLDSNPPTYTSLGTSDDYGSFEIGFRDLKRGRHFLGVAILDKGPPDVWSYMAACFEAP
jgi:hypothetical protein